MLRANKCYMHVLLCHMIPLHALGPILEVDVQLLESCRLLHPSCIHTLHASVKDSVKQTWMHSTFFPRRECLKCNGHGPLVLYVKWPIVHVTYAK
jgi:hypothetical protein